MQPISVPEHLHQQYYEEFSVGALALVFHYLLDLPWPEQEEWDLSAAWTAYRAVNRLFALPVLRTGNADPVMVQDYHLLLLAEEVRRQRPDFANPITYFHHVAWCQPDYFRVLPTTIRQHLLRAMSSFDVVAFHSRRWANSFLACCDEFLGGADCSAGLLRNGGRVTRVVVSPGAIDPTDIKANMQTGRFEYWHRELLRIAAGRWTLGRVERADLWKNPLRGLLAVERFLQSHEDAVGRTWFPTVLSPTRPWRPQYRSYLEECRKVAERINEKFSTTTMDAPVTLFAEGAPLAPDRALALAVMHIADAMIASPTFDGLNIVPLETAILSRHDPVIILSENAGAYEELSDVVIGVNPFDVAEISEAIARAYRMPFQERRTKAKNLRAKVDARSPRTWLEDQLNALLD